MAAGDFWGELQPAAVRTPVSILREQAAALAPRTQYLIEARVESEVVGGKFVHSLDLVVSALDNYTYRLFQIEHDINLYPVRERYKPSEFATEDEFKGWLRQRLSSAETRKVISNLMAQAQV